MMSLKLFSPKEKHLCCLLFAVCYLLLILPQAKSFEYQSGRYAFRASGHGTFGLMTETNNGLYDFRLRGQFNYAVAPGWTLGFVYAIDELAIYQDQYFTDAFIFTEGPCGRAEIGFTNSVAGKLGVGLPDVGNLRINNANLAFRHIENLGPMISNPTIVDTRYSFRVSTVSVPTNPVQVGVSFAPGFFNDNFNYQSDIAIRFRQPQGLIRYSIFAAASFIDSPNDLIADIYTPTVTAESRMQFAAGTNIQYNSYNIGLTLRAIYDHNAIGMPSDGLQFGAGISYDFLQHSVSFSYILSVVGIWNNHDTLIGDVSPFTTHTAIASYRQRFNQNWEASFSAGAVISPDDNHPFAAANIHFRF
ncbi:MAG: hypothetical protein FWC83_01595 [Alphaproteobacteria bacterium]|nr:hypothetical protein [Alphaproteobacteria bacterium]